MSQLLIDRPELTLGPEGLSFEDETRLRGALGQLTAALGRALLECAAQPAAAPKAAKELFAALAPLHGFCQEITFVASADERQPDINIEGVFVDPVELSACIEQMPKSEYVAKLIELFHGNHMVSFTIWREATPQALGHLLALAAPTLAKATPSGQKPARIGDGLAEAGIVTISVLDREDMVPAKQGLSWRVRIALSLVSKSLRQLSLHLRASGREPLQVRVTLMREIMHPLRADGGLAEFVLNADLAQTSGMELEHVDVQGEVVMAMTTQQVLAVVRHLVHPLTGPESGNVDFAWRARALALLKRCFPRIADLLDDDAVAVLRTMIGNKLLAREELPANLRDALDTEQLTNAFLANPEPHLARLRAVHDLDTWRQFGSSFAAIAGELIRRKQYAWVVQVAETLSELSGPSSTAAPRVRQLAGKAHATCASTANLERMATQLPKLPPEERQRVYALLAGIGPAVPPLLVRRLHESGDETHRASLRALLAGLGRAAMPMVIAALRTKQQRPETCRDLLLVLAALHDATAYDLAAGFLEVDHPRVRQAAFVAIARMDAVRAQPELLRALGDPSVLVQTSAVDGLGNLGSHDAAFLSFLGELFDGKRQPKLGAGAHANRELANDLSGYYHLLTAGCAAVASLARHGGLALAALEPPLIHSLKKLDGGLVALALRVLGKGPDLDRIEEDRVGAAMGLVTALAWIGTKASLSVLREACKYPDARVARLADRAMDEITARSA